MNKLLEKLKQFFYKLKNNKTPLLSQKNIKIEINKEENKTQFKEYLSVKEKQKILQIQNEYENGKLSHKDLTMLELMDLIELYKNQIYELDTKISFKKQKVNEL